MSQWCNSWARWFLVSAVLLLGAFLLLPYVSSATATNIIQYKDTLSDSGPGEQSNHTIAFQLNTAVGPGGRFEITPPSGFSIASSTYFDARNVELLVNGVPRTSATSASPGVDRVDITPGSPGQIVYTLAPDGSITSGSQIELKIGSQTSTAIPAFTTYSSSTGTTTYSGDIEPIQNSLTLGRHDVRVEVYSGGLVADAEPVIFIVEKVNIPSVDTTEEIPPYRFNPTPTSTVGGTTLSVEIGLETDEFAICKFSTASGTPFTSMTNTFSNTGLIYHTTVVPVTFGQLNIFYVRCIDDENNFNIDDFLIAFAVNDQPTGQSNTDGDIEGSGTGTGNQGTGDGTGSGGTTGDSSGDQPAQGTESGSSGGSGGSGGGGGRGDDDNNTAGGAFEPDEAPYRSGDGRVIISGYAYPDAQVTILVDGQIARVTTANSSGVYSVTLDGIARGAYTFGIYGTDDNGVKSSTFSTSFTVTGARTSELSNINILPSISVDPDPVDIGQTVTISGYGLSNSEIRIQNGRVNGSLTDFTTNSDATGFWSIDLNTSSFRQDTYQVRARAIQSGTRSTNFSDYTFYGVGQTADVPINADLNRDGSVNLIDFSILLFWWNSDGGDSDPPADINRDGGVNLTDFSILLFNWTG